MRKIITNTFATLDGVMQAPGGPEEDRSGNFNYGGWSVNYWDDIMSQTMDEASQTPYDLLLGRKTYEIFAAHWPFIKDNPIADKFNRITKYVATQTLTSSSWQNTVLLNQDFVRQIKEVKAQEGVEIQVHGSSDLLQTLLQHHLIDELRVWTFPTLIGHGKRLFGEGTLPSNLTLTDHKVSGTGVIMATYVPNGKISIGSFALEEPTELEIKRREKNK